MKQTNLLYYGYNRETYQACRDQISSTNRRHALMINLWFVISNLLYVIFSLMRVFGVDRGSTPFYAAFLVVSASFGVFLLALRKQAERYTSLTVYASVVLLLLYGIEVSIAKPYMAAAMFPLLLVLVATAYIDNMLRMMLVLAGFSAVFILSSFSQKAVSIAYEDTYNILITLFLAAALHYAFQHTRMMQFVLYQKNLQNQRELEVSSSFDALTSLLNRGRFFSMTDRILHEKDGEYMALCLLDLDGFKQINDQLGHQMGDKAIQMTGQTILEVMRIDESERWSFPERVLKERGSFAGRLGGDEFIVLIRGCHNAEEVEQLLGQVLKKLNDVRFEGLSGIHASFGVTTLAAGEDIDAAYTRADAALYASKRAGKNQIRSSEE
ncbi:MAG: GGDEF domain-containing protein [Butyrivibrio sp.]|nr:GGDEF domain-containing protein [Butyrivibrio sp.]